MARIPPRKLAVLALAGALALLGAAGAHAELVREGDIVVSFVGGISPARLPRTVPAPVTVQLGAQIKTTDGSIPPRLEQIVLQINRHGSLRPDGLPTCPIGKLESVSAATARRACAAALVGHGKVASRITLPEQAPFDSTGPLLAFNGRVGGRPAILAQVTSVQPLPLTYVIVFKVTKAAHGEYGTVLSAGLPLIASHYGYISAFELSLGRRYTRDGRAQSFASADCPAPAGFPGAPFALARSSYGFAGGLTVSSVLVRQCRVGVRG